MTQTINIDRVKRQTFHERLRVLANIEPFALFNGFYVLFGFTLTISFFAAAFLALTKHHEATESLFQVAPVSTVLWGIAYGAWPDRLRWAWSILTVVATLGMVVAIFVVLGQSGSSTLLEGLIEGACALPVFWTVAFAVKKYFS